MLLDYIKSPSITDVPVTYILSAKIAYRQYEIAIDLRKSFDNFFYWNLYKDEMKSPQIAQVSVTYTYMNKKRNLTV